MVKAVEEVCGDECKIRVGLHSGTVIGGVVGQKDPRVRSFNQSLHPGGLFNFLHKPPEQYSYNVS